MNKKYKYLIIAALVISFFALVSAGYLITSPTSDPVTFNPTPTPTASPSPTPTQAPLATLSKVTVSKTVLTVEEQVTLSTTLSDHTPGLIVYFYNNLNLQVGQATTDANGFASTSTYQPEGTWTFYAQVNHP